MWRDTLRGWRAFALTFFTLLGVFEFAEVAGDLVGFTDLGTYASFGGITPEVEIQRLFSLVILSTAVCIASAATVYAIYTKQAWAIRAGTIAGIILLLYAFYQILSGLFILKLNNLGLVFTGALFGLFGIFSFWIVRRF
ncbi:MAG: hypothetical protein HY741_25440 [Chloroflexi bacterium]|nr:hypothetical protein [Chloroflexota bacterium]